jgi:hypothetical protein
MGKCDITNGRKLRTCKTDVAGVKAIHLINWTELDYKNFKWDATDTEKIVNVIDTGGTAANAYTFELIRGATFDQNNTVDRVAGTSFWDGTLTCTVKTQDSATQALLKAASYGQPRVLVEYYAARGEAPIYVLAGEESGANVSVSPVSGGELGSFKGYNIEITTNEKTMASYVDNTIIGTTAGTGIEILLVAETP